MNPEEVLPEQNINRQNIVNHDIESNLKFPIQPIKSAVMSPIIFSSADYDNRKSRKPRRSETEKLISLDKRQGVHSNIN